MKQYLTINDLKANARAHLLGRYSSFVSAMFWVLLLNLSFQISAAPSHFSILEILFIIFSQVLLIILQACLQSGQILMNLNTACGNPIRSSMIFLGFRIYPAKVICIKLFITVLQLITSAPAFYCAHRFSTTGKNNFLYAGIGFTLVWIGVSCYIALTYGQALYLLHDYPKKSAKELLHLSAEIMHGLKWKLFLIELSFIPLRILALLSLNIGMLWVQPYLYQTKAEFFLDIMKE